MKNEEIKWLHISLYAHSNSSHPYLVEDGYVYFTDKTMPENIEHYALNWEEEKAYNHQLVYDLQPEGFRGTHVEYEFVPSPPEKWLRDNIDDLTKKITNANKKLTILKKTLNIN
jgi:hypothetical protein